MEQHPVPQNVTTFQFRLIGDMTIKQFGYLAGGAVVGYVSYKLPLPFFFTWPLAITSVTLGIGLAFVPIEERPMDVWLLSFIKSIYSPTQYLWQKTAPPETVPPPVKPQPKAPSAPPMVQPVLQPTPAPPVNPQVIVAKQAASIAETLEHLFAVHPTPKTPPVHTTPATPTQPAAPVPTPTPGHHAAIPQRPTSAWTPSTIWSQRVWDPFGWVKHLFSSRPPSPKLTTQVPTYPDIFTSGGNLPSLTGKKVDLTQPTQPVPSAQAAAIAAVQAQAATKEQELTKKLEGLQAELATKTTTDARILELQKQLTDVLSERSKMEAELTKLRAKTTQTPQTVVSPVAAAHQALSEPTVRIITADTAVKAGLPRLTTFPNVVTGIIKDSEGSLLPGVLVTVRDKEDIPVRALKTNKLGQFAASTPLPSGTYTVDIEDPRQLHFFDRVRITLNGTIMSPIEVTSRSKKQMERSKLEKAIFGNQNT